MKTPTHLALTLLILTLPTVIEAAPLERQVVRFELTQATQMGQSVYLLGDRPELGAWDVTRAVRMSADQYPKWTLSISLPKGAKYQYRYVLRSNDPAQLASSQNAVQEQQTRTGQAGQQSALRRVTLEYYSGWSQAAVVYEDAKGSYQQAVLTRVGQGRSAQESLWRAELVTQLEDFNFLVHNRQGRVDRPTGAVSYSSRHSTVVLQDGRITSYRPRSTAQKGSVQVVRNWRSRILGNSRDVYVYLPRGYQAAGNSRRYPVVYMHDGQNLFGPKAMFGGWRVAEALNGSIAKGRCQEVIVIGLANTSQRMQEYIPPEDGGRADEYLRFVVEEIKPWVDSRYRTLRDAANTAVMGSSLGGIVSLYMGWQRPDVFGKVGSLSGSYWLKKFTAKMAKDSKKALKIWLDSGNAGASQDGMEGTVAVRDLLLKKGYSLSGDLQHFIDYGAQHNELYWRGRVHRAFEFLFPAE